MGEKTLVEAHKHCQNNRAEVLSSDFCGCFKCLQTFSASAVTDWFDPLDGVGQTAQCPYCGMDCVIGSASGYSINIDFLESMNKRWCSVTRTVIVQDYPDRTS